MKTPTRLAACAATCCCALAALAAAVPLRWTVETSRAEPAKFDAYRGETLAFEAALKTAGRPLQAPLNYSLYWQTNGMGTAWWSAPCATPTTPTNVLFATWSPTNDVGARAYTCFIGEPGTIYHAAFQLRLRESPGTHPNELPLPTRYIDFAEVEVRNPPWPSLETVPPVVSNIVTRQYVEDLGISGGTDTNAVREIVADAIRTNATIAAHGDAIATNKAEIASIPRIVESADNPGVAASADRADMADSATEAYSAYTAMYADNATQAEYAGRSGSATSADAIGRYYANDIAAIELAATNAEAQAAANAAAIESHVANASNPHGVTAEQVGAYRIVNGIAFDPDFPRVVVGDYSSGVGILYSTGFEVADGSDSIFYGNTGLSGYRTGGAGYQNFRFDFPIAPSGTFALTSDIPDVSGIESNAAAIVEVALAATNYTDAATNAALAAAMAYTDAHTGGVAQVEYVYSADGFRRHDVDGNLFEAAIVTGGVFRVVSTKPDRRFDQAYTYAGKHYKSSGAWDGYIWKHNRVEGGYDAVVYYMYEGRFWIDNVGDLLTYKDLNPVNGDDMSPTNTLPNVTVTFTPQGAPVWPPTPFDRFARPSDVAAETARAVAAEADVALDATNYTDAATNSLWEFKRDRTDLAVYEPANERWTWTSADTNAPAGWLDAANAFAAPKPVHDGAGWTVAQIGNSPMHAAPTDPATGTSLEFTFKVSKFGTKTFVATAARTSATDTTPVPVDGQALVRTYDLASLTNQPGVAVGLGSSCSGTGSAIGQNAHALNNGAVAIGAGAQTSAQNGVAVGGSSQAGVMYSTAIGPGAKTGSSATYSVQLGPGTCNAANTLQFCSVPIGKTDAWMSEFTLDAAVVVPQATNALSEAKAYTDGKIGDISAVLDAILGGH